MATDTMPIGRTRGVVGDDSVPDLTSRILVGCLIAFHVLFPLDVGFPAVSLLGHPLNSGTAATLAVFVIVWIRSDGAVSAFLREPYCLLQTAFCVFLVISALMSASSPSALHACLVYYAAFVLNYAILRFVTRAWGPEWLSTAVVYLAVAAAAVGIMRGVLGIPLPLYDMWFERQFNARVFDYTQANARADGTMNNAIVYGVLMVLFIPYVSALKPTLWRIVALSAVIAAAGLSGSRTVLVAVLFAFGAVAIYRRRTLRLLIPASVAILLVAVFVGSSLTIEEGSRLDFLLQRAGVRPEAAVGVSAAALGISLRREVITEALHEMTTRWDEPTWLVGRGYLSAALVGQRILPWYNTVDNVFLTVIYERGLIGIVLFLAAGLTFVIRTRHAATRTLHWYSPLALALAGLSFSWVTYSTFTILVAGSMAIAMAHEEQVRRSAAIRNRA